MTKVKAIRVNDIVSESRAIKKYMLGKSERKRVHTVPSGGFIEAYDLRYSFTARKCIIFKNVA